MPVTVRWHPEAISDLTRAAEWYRTQDDDPRLVAGFERAVSREVIRVASAPESWPIARGQYRQKLFAGPFPYARIYRVHDETVFVVAVAHQRRAPGYWRGR
jgi:plasmid stabilization system protein ParE